MIQLLRTQLDARRLGVHQDDLRRREQEALARLGQVTLGEGGARSGRLVALATEAAAVGSQLEVLSAVRPSPADADLSRRRAALAQKLRDLHLTAGRLAMAMPTAAAGSEEVETIRVELAHAARERERLSAEGRRVGEDVGQRLRAWLAPRAPMLIAMALGWWVARRYSESHFREIFKSLGLSHRRSGHHLTSLSTDTLLVLYGLPLFAALVCAYLGHRLAPWIQGLAHDYRVRTGRVASES